MTRLAQLLLILALVGGGYQWWKSHERASFERKVLASANHNGFVPVEMPDGAPANTVVILAPLNCPREAGQRAEALAKRLTEMGIPNLKTNHYSVQDVRLERFDALNRTAVILRGEIPIVMINGRGKANPTIDQVTAEYGVPRNK